MELALVAKQVAVLAVLMAVGYIGAKKNVINESTSKGIASILTNIALPALLITTFNMTYTSETLKGILMTILYSFGAHIITAILVKFLYIKYPKGKNGVLRFGSIIANSGFMGLPLLNELFGQEAALYGSVYMIPYHAILWTYGEGLLAKEKETFDIKKLIKNPAIIAIIIGAFIFAFNIQMPYVLSKSFSLLSGLTSPLSMLLLGEKIARLKFKEIIGDKDIYYACFAKLIVIPIIIFLILNIIKGPKLIKDIVVFMQSLPAPILLVVLTQKHEGEIEFASKFAVVSHILSVITIPLVSLFM